MRQFKEKNPPTFEMIQNGRLSEQQIKAKKILQERGRAASYKILVINIQY